MSTATAPTVLRLADWQARAATHRQRALSHTGPARMRRDRSEPHPILDFLFDYYMDLYKWAAKAMPWIGSELLLDCFELAVALRDLDMRASPYDLTPWQREPVRIETPEGRQQYEQEQRQLANQARPLRQRLINALRATVIN